MKRIIALMFVVGIGGAAGFVLADHFGLAGLLVAIPLSVAWGYAMGGIMRDW